MTETSVVAARKPEYELLDTGVFDENRYFDVFVEYAKAAPEDILIRVTVVNRGAETASIDILPTVWFRNTWSWGWDARKPQLSGDTTAEGARGIRVSHFDMAERWLLCEGNPELLFTENETNIERLYGIANRNPYVKDGINDFLVGGRNNVVNPEKIGTKASARYHLDLAAGQKATVRLRLTVNPSPEAFGNVFDEVFLERREEADEFYDAVSSQGAYPGRANGPAPGFRLRALEQAVLPLQRPTMATRGSVRARTTPFASSWT